MNKRIGNVLTVVGIIILSSLAIADAELTVTQDDFSNAKITTLRINSMEENASSLFISCRPESGIDIQLAFNGTIFPDDLTDNGMKVGITHKFDTANQSYTTDWHMNTMKYENAWYQGDKGRFLDEAAKAGQLNLRLNQNGDVVRFGFSDAVAHVAAVRTACSSR